MGVGAWGPTTGAVGSGSHPFCLRIQGVCVIASVPIESISVSSSVSSNATLTFTIVDTTAAIAVPAAWADVELLDTTEEEWIFGGVVMGVEVEQGVPGVRVMSVRCVDYGVLLDVAPLATSLTAIPIPSYLDQNVQNVAGSLPLGGVTAIATASGRIPTGYDWSLWSEITFAAGSSGRSAIEAVAEELEDPSITGAKGGLAVYITPLKELACHPPSATIGTAPLEIRQNPTTGSHTAATAISVDHDYRTLETGVYVSDTEPTPYENSGLVTGSVNGYAVMPGSISRPLLTNEDRITGGRGYVATHGTTSICEVEVVGTVNFFPAQALTVYYPDLSVDGTFAITAVSTRFLGGLKRRSSIQFRTATTAAGAERGTFSRWNRTRHARAGVRT